MLGKGLGSLIPDQNNSKPEENRPEEENFNFPDINGPLASSEFSNDGLAAPASLPSSEPPQTPVSPALNNEVQKPNPPAAPLEQSETKPNETVNQNFRAPNLNGSREVNNPNPLASPSLSNNSGLASPPSEPTADSAYENADKNTAPSGHIFHIEVDKIRPNPFQPRRYFEETALKDLAASIREFGILQPLTVTKKVTDTDNGADVEYELIAGERRLMASKLAGLERVPVIIKNSNTSNKNRLELAIIENLQRENLNPIESARAFSKLQDEYGLTQREIASRLGKSREVIANSMRLLSLPSYIQEAVSVGKIGESQARLLLSISNLESQEKLFEDLIKNNLSVRELKGRIASTNARANAIDRYQNLDPEVKYLEEQLSELLGTKVKVDKSGSTGKITISFSSPEELKSIIDRVSKDNSEL